MRGDAVAEVEGRLVGEALEADQFQTLEHAASCFALQNSKYEIRNP